jgi:hypothetical protein
VKTHIKMCIKIIENIPLRIMLNIPLGKAKRTSLIRSSELRVKSNYRNQFLFTSFFEEIDTESCSSVHAKIF